MENFVSLGRARDDDISASSLCNATRHHSLLREIAQAPLAQMRKDVDKRDVILGHELTLESEVIQSAELQTLVLVLLSDDLMCVLERLVLSTHPNWMHLLNEGTDDAPPDGTSQPQLAL